MLHISPTDAILGGIRYELTSDQAHAMATQLKAQKAPSAPWGFSHWSEAAACECLTQAGYKLSSPHDQADSRDKTAREQHLDPREATANPLVPCDDCGQLKNIDMMLENPEPHKDTEQYKPQICPECLVKVAQDLAQELADIKASDEGQQAQIVQELRENLYNSQQQVSTQGETIADIETRLTATRQQLQEANELTE